MYIKKNTICLCQSEDALSFSTSPEENQKGMAIEVRHAVGPKDSEVMHFPKYFK